MARSRRTSAVLDLPMLLGAFNYRSPATRSPAICTWCSTSAARKLDQRTKPHLWTGAPMFAPAYTRISCRVSWRWRLHAVPVSRDRTRLLLTPCSRKIWVARLYRPTYATANMGIHPVLSCLTGVWCYRTERADRRLWVAASSM